MHIHIHTHAHIFPVHVICAHRLALPVTSNMLIKKKMVGQRRETLEVEHSELSREERKDFIHIHTN